MIISIFFMVEMTLLFVIVLTRNKGAKPKSDGLDINRSHGLIRSLTYFVNLCACMSLTFVPIVMSHLYKPLLGLSKDVVLGLPLSAEMLGGILAIVFAGWCINKQGWKRIIYLGALLLAAGNLLSGIGTSPIFFIFCRAMAGFGLGCIMMVIRSLVVSLPENNAAIAQFSAGSIAGLNCGAVMGGLLADRLGYYAVFYLAAFAALIPFIFVHGLMTEFKIEARETSDTAPLAKFCHFIADKKAIIFLLCIFIPYFISGAFLDYYFPLFAAGNGLSQSDISRGFLLNGIFIIYLGPVLTQFAVRKLGDARGMMVSMFIVITALAFFVRYGTIAAAFIIIVLLGIAESFGVSMKTTYFLNLKGIKDMEINQGIAFFSIMVNFSRMAGPVIYGLALGLGARMGVGLISLVLLMLLLVFIFSARFKPMPGNAVG
jgi:predicted MFS family arabinose efflux permease